MIFLANFGMALLFFILGYFLGTKITEHKSVKIMKMMAEIGSRIKKEASDENSN